MPMFNQSSVSVATGRMRRYLGPEALDLVGATGLPAGVSFSGAGSYNNAGVLAVQSSGTVTHNPTGWYDGTACIDFTPSSDINAEFRVYLSGLPAGVDLSSDDGIAFEFGIPTDLDTTKQNFAINFDYSTDASSLFPANIGYMRVWVCDQTAATTKEKGGRKYIRNRWDSTAATDALCGAWPGIVNVGVSNGTGADRNLPAKWIRFRCSRFAGKTLKFKSIRLGGRCTPTIILGSDSITPEALASSMAYAATRGLPTYVNQYVSQLSADAKSLDRARRIYAAGVEVNGNDLVDRPLGSTILTQPEMAAAVQGTRSALDAYGFTRGGKTWISNNNSTSYLMISELKKAGYVQCRNGGTDGRYVFAEGGVPDAYRQPARSLDGMNWAEVQPIIDRAIQYGCVLWIYWHGVISSTRIDADRNANVTGTAGAPIARNAGETPAQYRARAVGLGAGIGAATVTYFDARIGPSALGVWQEELHQLFDYLAPKNQDGSCVVLGPDEYAKEVGLTV